MPPAECSASFSSSLERSRSRQWKKSCCSVMPKSTSAGMRVIQSMNAGLKSSRRATGSWSCGTVAMNRLLKSTLSNSTRRREWLSSVVARGALDRLDVEDRDDGGQVRHVRLDQQRAPAGSPCARSRPPRARRRRSEEPKNPSLSSPVSRFVPPGQSATGPPFGLMPPIGS